MNKRFFLGANSPVGFYSLYDDFVSPGEGDFLWVIKGGPGCGKSSFMKKLGAAAEGRGLDVEYIYCSADPESLDGVYIPKLKTAYVDGTAPHIIEASLAGTDSLYLDLSRFYDRAALRGKSGELRELYREYRGLYSRAYGVLAAAGAVAADKLPGLVGEEERKAALRRATGVITRELGKPALKAGPSGGEVHSRFISAFTCKGPVFLGDTVTALCPRIYTLDNDYGMAGAYLDEIVKAAEERGVGVIACPDPMRPDTLEAALLPELGLGFLAISSRRGYDGEVYRHVRLDALVDPDRIRELRPRFRSASRMYSSLLTEAESSLAEAKKIHDEIEMIYNPHIDFKGLYALAAEHIKHCL